MAGLEPAISASQMPRITNFPTSSYCLEEGVGFEPTEPFRVHWFSRPAPSTTRTSLQLILSRPESIWGLLLESCSLLTMVNTVTTRKPNLIFATRGGVEPPNSTVKVWWLCQFVYRAIYISNMSKNIFFWASDRVRTYDLMITNHLLYQLSYKGI